MIRISLIYFLVVITAGGLLLFNKGMPIHGSIWSLLQIHIELALFGWLLQFVMGTAYWILPRYLESPGRGNETVAWGMMVLLNAGLWIYIFTHLEVLPAYGFMAARILELSSVGVFIYLHWNRIVPYQRGH